MFRKMRREKQSLSPEICEDILNRGTSGVLSLSGDDGYPYAVPLSYVYTDGKIYFHSAKTGHKIDAVKRSGKASFCVIDKDEIVPSEYTTYFRSVIAFGKIKIISDDEDKLTAIKKLALKYSPDESSESLDSAIKKEWSPLCMLEMSISHMTGKQAIELCRR